MRRLVKVIAGLRFSLVSVKDFLEHTPHSFKSIMQPLNTACCTLSYGSIEIFIFLEEALQLLINFTAPLD